MEMDRQKQLMADVDASYGLLGDLERDVSEINLGGFDLINDDE